VDLLSIRGRPNFDDQGGIGRSDIGNRAIGGTNDVNCCSGKRPGPAAIAERRFTRHVRRRSIAFAVVAFQMLQISVDLIAKSELTDGVFQPSDQNVFLIHLGQGFVKNFDVENI
jgi:hypothetical protein